jgi:hypothetical protein
MRGTEQIQTRGGTEVEIEVVEPLAGGGCRLDLSADSRQWRVNVSTSGTRGGLRPGDQRHVWRVKVSASGTPEPVTGWNARGEVDTDAELPDWMDDALAHIGGG